MRLLWVWPAEWELSNVLISSVLSIARLVKGRGTFCGQNRDPGGKKGCDKRV